MKDRGMNKVVLVKRRTRLEELKRRYNTAEQARFYVEHLGADFSDYEEEHRRYYAEFEKARAIAGRVARVQEIDRDYIPNMIFGPEDIVVAVGQDGLVANVMKYLSGQPLIGVNPDTRRWDGYLLPFEAGGENPAAGDRQEALYEAGDDGKSGNRRWAGSVRCE